MVLAVGADYLEAMVLSAGCMVPSIARAKKLNFLTMRWIYFISSFSRIGSLESCLAYSCLAPYFGGDYG